MQYNRKKDVGIYGRMAKWYDKNTKNSRLVELRSYTEIVSQKIPQGAEVLEVAPGPGYLAIELAKRGYSVTGVEISNDFVAIAKQNANEAGVKVGFLQGNASLLPCNDEAFDFVICTAAFKNFKEPVNALNEMYRVLNPNGSALIIDMNPSPTKTDIDNELNKNNAKGFDRLFLSFAFKTFLSRNAYSNASFVEFISQTSFRSHEIKKEGICTFVRLYK